MLLTFFLTCIILSSNLQVHRVVDNSRFNRKRNGVRVPPSVGHRDASIERISRKFFVSAFAVTVFRTLLLTFKHPHGKCEDAFLFTKGHGPSCCCQQHDTSSEYKGLSMRGAPRIVVDVHDASNRISIRLLWQMRDPDSS